MANYIKVNGLFLKGYRQIVGLDGRDYITQLEFTRSAEEAADIPANILIRVLAGARKTLLRQDAAPTYVFSIDSTDPREALPTATPVGEKPKFKFPATETASVTTFATGTFLGSGLLTNEKTPEPAPKVTKGARTVCKNPVKLDLEWLRSYVLKRGISSTQLALDFGYTGEKKYYGTKILKGLLNLSREQCEQFIKIHPAAATRLIKE